WDPLTDPHLVQRFAEGDWQGKDANCQYVKERFSLDREPGPLFAVVSRLVYQKGIDLTVQAADMIVAAGGSLVIYGQGEPELEAAVRDLHMRYPGRVGVHVGFQEYE